MQGILSQVAVQAPSPPNAPMRLTAHLSPFPQKNSPSSIILAIAVSPRNLYYRGDHLRALVALVYDLIAQGFTEFVFAIGDREQVSGYQFEGKSQKTALQQAIGVGKQWKTAFLIELAKHFSDDSREAINIFHWGCTETEVTNLGKTYNSEKKAYATRNNQNLTTLSAEKSEAELKKEKDGKKAEEHTWLAMLVKRKLITYMAVPFGLNTPQYATRCQPARIKIHIAHITDTIDGIKAVTDPHVQRYYEYQRQGYAQQEKALEDKLKDADFCRRLRELSTATSTERLRLSQKKEGDLSTDRIVLMENGLIGESAGMAAFSKLFGVRGRKTYMCYAITSSIIGEQVFRLVFDALPDGGTERLDIKYTNTGVEKGTFVLMGTPQAIQRLATLPTPSLQAQTVTMDEPPPASLPASSTMQPATASTAAVDSSKDKVAVVTPRSLPTPPVTQAPAVPTPRHSSHAGVYTIPFAAMGMQIVPLITRYGGGLYMMPSMPVAPQHNAHSAVQYSSSFTPSVLRPSAA
jgi:hypothetical protein